MDLDWEHFDEGVFIYYAQNAHPLSRFPRTQWGMDKEVLLSDTRVLDVLLQNSDRHLGHFVMGEHWSHGQWVQGRWKGKMQPVLIDHAAGFRKAGIQRGMNRRTAPASPNGA